MVNRPSMDLGQDEDFVFKHPYFFSNLTFKFEGLTAQIEKDLQNVIKSMDGVVSDESKHVFTDVLRLPSLDRTQKYYSITYLSDCMLAEDILEIEDYKLTDTNYPNLGEISITEQTNYCCENAKYTWKSKSCFSYFTQKVCCKQCIETKKLPYHESIETNNNCSINQSNGKTIDSNVHEPNEKSQGDGVNTLNEGINGLQTHNSIERHSSDSVQHNFTVVNIDEDFLIQAPADEVDQEEEEVINNKSDSSDIEIIEELTNIPKSSSLNQKSKISKSAKQVKRRRMSSESSSKSGNSSAPIRLPSSKQKRSFSSPTSKRICNGLPSVQRIDDSSEESSRDKEVRANRDHQEPSCSKHDPVISKKNIKPSISRWVKKSNLQKSASVREKPPSNDEPNNSESEEGGNQNFLIIANERKNWWLHLPPPPHHRSHSGRNFRCDEQKLMITYLVVKNLIHNSTSRKPWSSLMEDGYLKYRTVESLNNHFRKTILPKIETFGLPEQIVKRFRHVRKMHQRQLVMGNENKFSQSSGDPTIRQHVRAMI